MFRYLAKAAVAVSFIGIAACGGEDEQEGHLDLVREASDVAMASVDVLQGSPTPGKLQSLSEDFGNLLENAESAQALPSADSKPFANAFRSEWEPALGKLYAASLAAIENPETTPELSAAIRKTHSKAAEFDKALSEFLAPKP